MDVRLKHAYWQVTALSLAAYLGGWVPGLGVAIAVTAGQTIHFASHRRNLRSFEVQVRATYLALLLIGLAPSLWIIHVGQFVGLNAKLITDYCPWHACSCLRPGIDRCR